MNYLQENRTLYNVCENIEAAFIVTVSDGTEMVQNHTVSNVIVPIVFIIVSLPMVFFGKQIVKTVAFFLHLHLLFMLD